MIANITMKVKNMPCHNDPVEHDLTVEEDTSKAVLVVSGYGTDDKLIKTLKSRENDLLKTNSFRNVSKPLFQFVNKTSANIGNKLSVLKSLALGSKIGETVPCNGHGNCKCCSLIGVNVDEVNGIPVTTAPGNCKSRNCIYLVTCRLCFKPYVGRTVQWISKRFDGHRTCFYKVLRNHEDVDELSDEYSLGLHICLLYTSPSPRDRTRSRMPSSA